MTTEKITVGKIVAKLRNTVPVCLMENGAEVKRYKNIEFPDELKALEASAFGFVIGTGDKIRFELHFDADVLPEEFPANRKSVSWAERAAAKAATVSTEDLAAAAADVIAAVTGSEVTPEPAQPAAEPAGDYTLATADGVIVAEVHTIDLTAPAEPAPVTEAPTELRFDVTGEQRKTLVAAVAEITGCKPEYKAAPVFTYTVGNCRIDRAGTLTGEITPALIDALAERGFAAMDEAA